MSWTLTCDCSGRYIKTDKTCSKCGINAYFNHTPKASAYRQLDVDYDCPITGKPIRSKHAHEENLKLHGKHVLEKGELKDAQKVRQATDEAFEDMVCETAAQLVHDLPAPMKAALEQELLTTDTKISRGTL